MRIPSVALNTNAFREVPGGHPKTSTLLFYSIAVEDYQGCHSWKVLFLTLLFRSLAGFAISIQLVPVQRYCESPPGVYNKD
jgi:hypothetical protein